MARMILGIFSDRGEAEHAVEELQTKGFDAKDISIIMKDREEAYQMANNTGANVAGGAASGIATGGVLGGLAGLLIGIGAITVPGVGAILIGGPIAAALGLTGAAATALSGAVTGALAGGLVGALIGLGLPEEEAKHYEARIKEGGILVAVPANTMAEEARNVLDEHGADMVRTVGFSDEGIREEEIHQPAYFSEVDRRKKR